MYVSGPLLEGAFRKLDSAYLLRSQFSAKPFRLRNERSHQLGAHDAMRETRIVLHIGRQHEQATRLVAARRWLPLKEHRRHSGPCAVDGRSQPCGARADDRHIGDPHEAATDTG